MMRSHAALLDERTPLTFADNRREALADPRKVRWSPTAAASSSYQSPPDEEEFETHTRSKAPLIWRDATNADLRAQLREWWTERTAKGTLSLTAEREMPNVPATLAMKPAEGGTCDGRLLVNVSWRRAAGALRADLRLIAGNGTYHSADRTREVGRYMSFIKDIINGCRNSDAIA
jgi:hypothetical protein